MGRTILARAKFGVTASTSCCPAGNHHNYNQSTIYFYMARPAGIEPATYGLEGQCRYNNSNSREQVAANKTAGYALALLPVISQDCPFFAPECPKSVPWDKPRCQPQHPMTTRTHEAGA